MDKNETASFTKRDTKIAKGIAVILLLTHHLYMGVLPAPMSLTGNSPLLVFATLSKVCVAIFAILSGYGLEISFKRKRESEICFQKKHLLSLMKPYWLVFALFSVLAVFYARPEYTPSAVYGTGVRGIANAICEALALRPVFATPTINQTWWYMEAALVMYLLFPLLRRLTEKVPYIVLPITAVPLILYTVFGNNVWDTCREIYWLFPFTAGIYAAHNGLLDRFAKFCGNKHAAAIIVSGLSVIVLAVGRAKIGLALDTFFGISIILFSRAVISRIPFVGSVLEYIGGYSSDIFLTHSFFYCYFVSQTIFAKKFLWSESPIIELLALPLLLAMSLGASVVLKLIRERMDILIGKIKQKKHG